MNQPIEVRIDPLLDVAYIQYTSGAFAHTIDIWEDGFVAADIDTSGAVRGIEVLALDDETLSVARSYATSRDLAFPASIRRDASA